MHRSHVRLLMISTLVSGVLAVPPAHSQSDAAAGYDDLVALFERWRAFQAPIVREGVPVYTERAMAEQHGKLADYVRRLAQIDTTGWPVNRQVDYRIVEAEMNGLDFDHRVRRPWARDPAFYTMLFSSQTDVPAREGPVIEGAIELWQFEFPLSDSDAEELERRMRTIPPLLDQARGNLVGNARDLWVASIRTMKDQASVLGSLAERVDPARSGLLAAVRDAEEATAAFADWLEEQAPTRTWPSGLGIESYDWWTKNVHLVPYSWSEQVAMIRRELARALSSLALEEHRNRGLPELRPVSSEQEHRERFRAAVDEYLEFLDEEQVVTIRDYMKPALLARLGRFAPGGPPHFFSEVDYREPLTMRAHHYHWFDLARMREDPSESPIRRNPLLYNIYDSRAEGLATGMEELMMHAGLFDDRPRARELVWILLAQRAARALGELYMHSNDLTMEEAVRFASSWTPRGWLPEDGDLVWHEQHLYLRQPGYGTSYVIGKIQIEDLLGRAAARKGEAFVLQEFMDELDAAGVIPVSLISWEMTGHEGGFAAGGVLR